MIFRDFQTQQALDAAYDVEASVPDFMVFANQYIEGSAAALRDLPHHANVPFGPTLDEYVDIFPASQPGAPVLVFIHGGYWRMLTAKEHAFVARGFAPFGVTVVVANYALCPKVTVSEISRQMRAMTAWVSRNIHDYNGDADNITVAGHSAGGHLAAMCALTDWADYGLPRDTISNIVPISGLFDLEPIAKTYLQPEVRISARDIEESSPQRLLAPAPVDMLLTYGSDEPSEFSRQSEEFLAGWRAQGNRASFFPQLGRNHFTAITDLGDSDAPLSRAIYDLIGHTPRRSLPRRGHGIDRRLFAGGAR